VANVYIEALASGCPVVAANTGGAVEAVDHSVTGYLVPPRDPAAVAHALKPILLQPDLRVRLASAARERAESYFALDPYIRRVLECYRQAIDAARRDRASATT
jgi:glycosyltransferase involved in cell wall biosynthesis